MRNVVTTEGQIVNLDRFEAIRIVVGPYATGHAISIDRARALWDEGVVTANGRPSDEATGFVVVALSGLGRSSDPTRTVVARARTLSGLEAVWNLIRAGRPNVDLGRAVELEEGAIPSSPSEGPETMVTSYSPDDEPF